MMRIEITKNLNGVHKKLSTGNLNQAKKIMANQMMMDMNLEVPRRSGDLRDSAQVGSGGNSIVWDKPYAHRQYVNKGYQHQVGGAYWDLRAKGRFLKSWETVYAKALGVKYWT